MPASLVKDMPVPSSLLTLRVPQDGKLSDAYAVSLRLLDETSLPATVLLDAGSVVDTAAHLGTGRYACAPSGTAWTPDATVEVGVAEWTYRIASDGDDVVVRMPFEVVDDTVAATAEDVYCLISDVKALYATAQSDRVIRRTSLEWRAIVERYCRQRFRLVHESRIVSGRGSLRIHLQEPVLLASMATNGLADAVDLSVFDVQTERESRWNPKITRATTAPTLFSQSLSSTPFGAGLKTVLTGSWGFVEPETQSAPSLIQDASARGVALACQARDEERVEARVAGGPVVSEQTDQHTIQYGMSSGKSVGGLLSLLRDVGIRDSLDQYRAPIGIRGG